MISGTNFTVESYGTSHSFTKKQTNAEKYIIRVILRYCEYTDK